jgi:nucleotide-binding universal stress UspA family protein
MKDLDIKTILLPVDFSTASIDTIELAKRFAARFDASVNLVHVQEFCHPVGFTPVPIGLPVQVPDWSITLARQTGEKLLRELKEVAVRSGISPNKCHLRQGTPVFSEICILAKELDADLIVTPTHGYTGLKHLFLGSTAERLVQHSICPVLVAKKQLPIKRGSAGGFSEIDRILVPVDFSACSLAGLKYAIQLAAKFGSRITVLHVVNIGPAFTADGYAVYDLSRYCEIAREEAEEAMTDFVEQVKFDGVKFDTKITVGLLFDGISSAIAEEKVDLLVATTHGRTGIKHAVIGSTAELIVRRAPCPVLAVPSHPQERAKTLAALRERSRSTGQTLIPESVESERLTKRFRKAVKHPPPERRKTNKFRETHLLVKG